MQQNNIIKFYLPDCTPQKFLTIIVDKHNEFYCLPNVHRLRVTTALVVNITVASLDGLILLMSSMVKI